MSAVAPLTKENLLCFNKYIMIEYPLLDPGPSASDHNSHQSSVIVINVEKSHFYQLLLIWKLGEMISAAKVRNLCVKNGGGIVMIDEK